LSADDIHDPHGGDFSRAGAHGDDVRILFLPRPKDDRGSERTPSLYRILRQRHHVVGMSAPRDRLIYDPTRSRLPRLALYVVDKILLFLWGVLLARRSRATVVFCETAHHALAGLAIARFLGISCVWDSHGNGKLFYESLGKGGWSLRGIAFLETFLGKRVDALVTVSPADAAAYSGMGLDASRIHVLPVCISLREIDALLGSSRKAGVPARAGNPVLILIGSFGYEPNREALRWTNDVLAPELERRGIPCEIRIAGRNIPELQFHPYVRPLGFVDDIYGCIRDADICIVPVRRGVGMLTKVIDSMAVGTPVVMFDFASRGIPDLRDGIHAFVARTEEEFLRQVDRALSDPAATQAMSTRARGLVERNFDWDSHVAQLDAIVRGPSGSTGG